jgi:endonuclease YncB( thermonuclease family)
MRPTPRKPLVLIVVSLMGAAGAPVALVERVVDGDTVVVRPEGQAIKVRC